MPPARARRACLLPVAAASLALALCAPAAFGATGFGAPVTLTPKGEEGYFPSASINASGTGVVVWLRARGSRFDMRAATRPAGGRFGSAVALGRANQPGGGSPPFFPSASIGPRGEAAAAWLALDDEGDMRAVVARASAGGRFGAATQVSPAGQPAFAPLVAVDADGGTLALWTRLDASSGNTLLESAYAPRGEDFGDVETITADTQSANQPVVAFDADGDAVAAWTYGNGLQDVLQVAIRRAGGTFGTPKTVSSARLDAQDPSVAVNARGDAIVAWAQSGVTGSAIAFSAGRTTGSFGNGTAITPAKDTAILPQAGIDDAGRATLLWSFSETGFGGPGAVRAAVRPSGGRFGKPESIVSSDDETAFLRPRLAVDDTGRAWGSWEVSNLESAVSPLGGAQRTSPTGDFQSAGTIARDGAWASLSAAGSGQALGAYTLPSGSSSSAGIAAVLATR